MDAAPPRTRRGRRILLLVMGVTIIALLVAAGGVAVFAQQLEGNVEREDVFQELEEAERPEPEPTRALDILVLGTDSREGAGAEFQAEGDERVEGERADTTVLVHLNAARDAAWAVSIPRDSWIERPACRSRTGEQLPPTPAQFNTAFLDGGLACTVRTVEALTGVRIDHTAVLDFAGFQRMVDALDGVPVCVEAPFTPRRVDLELPPGRSVLDGRQALEFVRARYGVDDGSDISRIERQKQVMASLLDRALSRDVLVRPDRLVRFLSAVSDHLRVDRDLDLRELAWSLRQVDPARVRLITVPLDAAPGPAYQPGGRLYGRVAWDQQRAAELFADLRDDRLTAEAEPAPPTAEAPPPVEAPPAADAPVGPPAAAPPGTTAAAAACS